MPFNEYILENGFIAPESVKGKQKLWTNGGYDRVLYLPIPTKYKRSTNISSWRLINDVWEMFKHPGYEIALSATINY